MEGIVVPVTGIRTDRVRIGPIPAWVDYEPYEAPLAPDEHFINGGLCTLLNETQVDLCGPVRGWHVRNAERVVTTAGAERAAQVSVSFNPAFEDLYIHHVRVIRGAEVFEHALPENFEIYRRERRLERLVLDGRLTVSLITPDVRAGDLIETSYTIYGLNPALGGLHTAWIGFEWAAAILDTRHRLRHPNTREIATRAFLHPPTEHRTETDGVVDRRWRSHKRKAAEPADLIPPWMPLQAEIQFSEAKSWGEVAALFSPLYHDDADALPADIAAEIDALNSRCPTAQAKVVEALRYVQSQVRYLAVSIGEGGFQPRPLSAIWATRYGDCKDVSRLLTAIARRLGLHADPALVNTQVGEGLAAGLPSPTAFNHCIVRLQLDGRTYWMDATMRPQGGDLEHLHQPYFGHALALIGKDATLEPMTTPTSEHVVAVEEEVVLSPSVSDAALYSWKTTYSGWKADSLRDDLRNEGEAAVSKRYLRQLRDLWPLADLVQPTRFDDDPIANTLIVHEHYRIPSPWRAREGAAIEFSTKDMFVSGELVRLEFPSRSAPIHLARPRIITRTVRVKAPFVPRGESWDRRLEGEALSYTNSMTVERGGVFVLKQRLEIRADTMRGADAAHYAQVTEDMRRSDLVLTMLARGDKVVAPSGGGSLSWVGNALFYAAALIAIAAGFYWGAFGELP